VPRSDSPATAVEVAAHTRPNGGHVPGDFECPRISTSMTCPA
jgi:hypothetical protein